VLRLQNKKYHNLTLLETSEEKERRRRRRKRKTG
jgi:hypothetical protein